MTMGVLFIMKTLEDEQYIVIKAYKLTVLRIIIYCMSSLHIESTNSMIESIMPQPELTKRQEVLKLKLSPLLI